MHNYRCSCGSGEKCHSPGKHPLTRHGFKDATDDIVQIKKWWEEWPSANIGIATGLESNIIVIDVDPKNGGGNSLQSILRVAGEQKETLIAQSGGHKDGRHYYYTHPGGGIRSSSGLRPGLDIKANDGYVIAPPSIHATGRTYRWVSKAPIAPLPTWVYSIIHEKNIDTYKFSKKLRGKKIDVQNVPYIPAGKRNTRLFVLCRRMIDMSYKQDEAKNLLLQINDTKIETPKASEKYISDLVSRLYQRYR